MLGRVNVHDIQDLEDLAYKWIGVVDSLHLVTKQFYPHQLSFMSGAWVAKQSHEAQSSI